MIFYVSYAVLKKEIPRIYMDLYPPRCKSQMESANKGQKSNLTSTRGDTYTLLAAVLLAISLTTCRVVFFSTSVLSVPSMVCKRYGTKQHLEQKAVGKCHVKRGVVIR